MEYSCCVCKKIFKRSPALAKGKKLSCSPNCAQIARRSETDMECCVCGKTFRRCPARMKRAKTPTCSKGCANQMRTDRAAAEKQEIECVVCKALFMPSEFKRRKNVLTCSCRCGSIAKKSEEQKISFVKNGQCDTFKADGYQYFVKSTGRAIPIHRYVAEMAWGQEAIRGKLIHHRDGNRLNNSISNLQIVTRSEHAAIHQAEEKERRALSLKMLGANPEIEKKCVFCNKIKNKNSFPTDKKSGDGRTSRCRICYVIKGKKDVK